MMTMNEYRYLMRMRPPCPGALPKDGLLEAHEIDETFGGVHYWGIATYTRKLTKEECNQYELDQCHNIFQSENT